MDTDENYHRTKISKIQRKSLMDLPQSVLLEILSILPLKTLAVCRCVCKYFKNLTSLSSDFNSVYSRRAIQTLVLHIPDDHNKPTPYLHMFNPEADLAYGLDFSTKFKFDIPKISEPFSLILKNSCNGLLYLAGDCKDDPNSIIFNPLTNEYVTVPRGDIVRRVQFQLLGFGAVSKRYKVMRIFPASMHEACGVQVHEVGSHFWRDVETGSYLGTQGYLTSFSNATYLNGVAYMLWHSQASTFLVSFDFEKEEIGKIELPEVDNLYRHGWIARLGRVLGDCLCLGFTVFGADYRSQYLDLWVMRNGGVEDGVHWSIAFRMDHAAGPTFGRSIYQNIWPLRSLSDGKILMYSGSGHGLFCYDPSNNSLLSVGPELEQFAPLPEPFSLIPSFVPLAGQLSIDEAMVRRGV